MVGIADIADIAGIRITAIAGIAGIDKRGDTFRVLDITIAAARFPPKAVDRAAAFSYRA